MLLPKYKIMLLNRLVELISNSHGKAVLIAPSELLPVLGGPFGEIATKVELALKMKEVNLKTRVLSREGVYGRYYVLHEYSLIKTIKRIESRKKLS